MRRLATLIIASLAFAAPAAASWQPAPPTIKQAKHAIHAEYYFQGEHVDSCKRLGENIVCKAWNAGCFNDTAYGPSLEVVTDIVGVGPRMHVYTAGPPLYEIYAAYDGCDGHLT